jgi:hypothetical protein
MSLLDSLLNRSNSTRAWVADPAVSLVLDLDTNRLSGVGIGDRFDKLSFLGPGKGKRSAPITFVEKGLQIDIDANELVESFAFYFGHAQEAEFGRFQGVVQYRRTPVPLDSSVNEETIRNLLGEPYWRDQDEEETILFYEPAGGEWQIEFESDDRLKCLRIVNPPMMSDAQQRTAYGVTKPWPPT